MYFVKRINGLHLVTQEKEKGNAKQETQKQKRDKQEKKEQKHVPKDATDRKKNRITSQPLSAHFLEAVSGPCYGFVWSDLGTQVS